MKERNYAKTLFVGGTFNDSGGRHSKIVDIVANSIGTKNMTFHNGGSYTDIEKIVDSIKEHELIYWFADVPNNKPKLVREIKRKNKRCILVTSKRNINENYSFQELIYRALKPKSNLVVEISCSAERYQARIFDPLGNVFLDYNQDMTQVGAVLKLRTSQLLNYTRESSSYAGPALTVPNESAFFRVIKEYAHKMHDLIHAKPEAANRFFGNASFKSDRVYISRRNIDKRKIDNKSFVAVDTNKPLKYFGENKPSVDSPGQVLLYSQYPKVKYMLHTHAYIKCTPFTKNVVPCGALEEVDEIKELYPDKNSTDFFVNLRGHGSLALVSKVSSLKNIPYTIRNIPELHEVKI